MTAEKLRLVDGDGKYIYSWRFNVFGKDLDIISGQEPGSMAGTPRGISVFMDYPNIVASNPSKRISKDKEYVVIVVEKEFVEIG